MTDLLARSPLLAHAALGVLCAKLVAAAVLFDLAAYNAFSPTKAFASYALSLILLGLLVALALRHGRAIVPWSPLHVPVAMVAAAYLVATVFALDLTVALAGAEGRAVGLLTVLDTLFIYLAVTVLVRTPEALRWVGLTLAGVVILVVATEALQLLRVISGLTNSGRAIGTAGNSDPLGQLTSSLSAGWLGLAAAPAAGRAARAIAAAIATLAGIGWLASGTRAALLGLTAALLVLAVLWLLDTPRGERARRLVVIAVLAVVGSLGLGASPFGDRVARAANSIAPLLAGDLGAVDRDVSGRLDHYRVSLAAGLDRPLVGVGPDNYSVAYARYRLPGSGDFHRTHALQTSTHSWPLKVITDAGLAGLVALIAVMVVGLRQALRHRARPWVTAAGTMLVSYIVTSLFSINSVSTEWIPWLALGLVGARVGEIPVPEARTAKKDSRGRKRHRAAGGGAARVVAGVAVAVGLLLSLVPLNAWRASHDAAAARSALRAGADRADAAVAAAERSVEAAPWRAAYWGLLATAYGRDDRASDAIRALQRAAEIAPYETAYLTNLASAQILLARVGEGDDKMLQEAVASARRAVEIDPYRPENRFTFALALYYAKAYDKVVEEMELGMSIDPDTVPSHGFEIAARSYLRLDRLAEAERWSRLGLQDRGVPKETKVKLNVVLAQALFEAGRLDEALAAVQAALALDPDDSEARRVRRAIRSDQADP